MLNGEIKRILKDLKNRLDGEIGATQNYKRKQDLIKVFNHVSMAYGLAKNFLEDEDAPKTPGYKMDDIKG